MDKAVSITQLFVVVVLGPSGLWWASEVILSTSMLVLTACTFVCALMSSAPSDLCCSDFQELSLVVASGWDPGASSAEASLTALGQAKVKQFIAGIGGRQQQVSPAKSVGTASQSSAGLKDPNVAFAVLVIVECCLSSHVFHHCTC
jgi:hypothetical protein